MIDGAVIPLALIDTLLFSPAMGAMFENEEKAALLPKHAVNALGAQQSAVAIANLEAGDRDWDGHLLDCCAGCGVSGWSACLFSYCAPCLAFG